MSVRGRQLEERGRREFKGGQKGRWFRVNGSDGARVETQPRMMETGAKTEERKKRDRRGRRTARKKRTAKTSGVALHRRGLAVTTDYRLQRSPAWELPSCFPLNLPS